jgi:hypothetical protein
MPTPNLEQAAGWTGGAAILSMFGTMFVRFLMKTFRTDRLEAAATGADMNSYNRLQNEITRLEGIIVAQQKRTDELEARLDSLRDIELDDVADIATLAVLIAQMPCGRCQSPDDMFKQSQEILTRMNIRKRETQGIIRGV